MIKYSKEMLFEHVIKSTTLRKVLLSLGLSATGGNYTVLKKNIELHGIDISHFKTHSPKGFKFPPRRKNIQEYLVNGLYTQSYKLKKYLLDSDMLEYRCSCCQKEKWLDGKIPLELDHIDGDNKNNSLENLRLLCPNCHALTPTYRGKNKRK